jgi:hypothetical protein
VVTLTLGLARGRRWQGLSELEAQLAAIKKKSGKNHHHGKHATRAKAAEAAAAEAAAAEGGHGSVGGEGGGDSSVSKSTAGTSIHGRRVIQRLKSAIDDSTIERAADRLFGELETDGKVSRAGLHQKQKGASAPAL